MACMHVDTVYPHCGWSEAKTFTDALRAATDLPAFLTETHYANALMAAQLRACLDDPMSPTPKTTEEMQEEAALFDFRDSWRAFQRRSTVFHASRSCIIWKRLDLQIQVEDDLGVCPIRDRCF
jgi:hypothetical protein